MVGPTSISPHDLYVSIGTESVPLGIDVRRAPGFGGDDKMTVGARRREPEDVSAWAPQASGLLAITLGLSANFLDDHTMLEHGMVISDAHYAWCRSLQSGTLGWNPNLGR